MGCSHLCVCQNNFFACALASWQRTLCSHGKGDAKCRFDLHKALLILADHAAPAHLCCFFCFACDYRQPGEWGRTPLQYHPADRHRERERADRCRVRFMTQSDCNCWWFSSFRAVQNRRISQLFSHFLQHSFPPPPLWSSESLCLPLSVSLPLTPPLSVCLFMCLSLAVCVCVCAVLFEKCYCRQHCLCSPVKLPQLPWWMMWSSVVCQQLARGCS